MAARSLYDPTPHAWQARSHLYTSRSDTQVADDLARLRQLWHENARVRQQLIQLAKQYRHHGQRALRLVQLPGCQAALRAAVQGIIKRGLA